MTRLKHIALLISFLFYLNTYSQRWTNNYFQGEEPYGENLREFYDKGYLLIGRYGPNWPSFNWLIKTDINGEMVWNKVLGIETSYLLFEDIDYNLDGDMYIVGSTYYYSTDNYPDPLIFKLNPCGEKQWCRVFMQNGYNFSDALVVTSDDGVFLVLKYMGTEPFLDDICLAKFDTNGTLLWRQCYNSSDTLIHGLEAYDIILTIDGGFLLSGSCSYEYINPPF